MSVNGRMVVRNSNRVGLSFKCRKNGEELGVRDREGYVLIRRALTELGLILSYVINLFKITKLTLE